MGGCSASKVQYVSPVSTPEEAPSPQVPTPSTPSLADSSMPPLQPLRRSKSTGDLDRNRPRSSFAELIGTDKAQELDRNFGTLQSPRIKNGKPQVHPWERELNPDRVVIRLDQPEKVDLKEKLDLEAIKQAWTPGPDGTPPEGTTPMLWLVGMNVLIVGPETLVGVSAKGKEQRKAHASFVGGEKLGRIGGELGWDWMDQVFFIIPKSGRYMKGQTDRGLPQLQNVAKVFADCGLNVEARDYLTLGMHATLRARKYVESPAIAASAKPSPHSPLFLNPTDKKLLENLVDINLDDPHASEALLCQNRLMTGLCGLKQTLVAEIERLCDPNRRQQPTPLSDSDLQNIRESFAQAAMPAALNEYMEVFAGHLLSPLRNAMLGWAADASRRMLSDDDPTHSLQSTLQQVEHLPKQLLRLAVPELVDCEIALQPAPRARFVDTLRTLDTTQGLPVAPSATEIAEWVDARTPGADASNQALIKAYLDDADRRPQEFKAAALAFLCGMVASVGVPPEHDAQAQALNLPPTSRRTELFDAILERTHTLPGWLKVTLNVCLFQAIDALPPSARSSAMERLKGQ